MYKVAIEQRVYEDLDKIPSKEVDKIYKKIIQLEDNPRPSGSQKLKSRDDRYRIRQGDYRIVYTINDLEKIVGVVLVRHRKDVYNAGQL